MCICWKRAVADISKFFSQFSVEIAERAADVRLGECSGETQGRREIHEERKRRNGTQTHADEGDATGPATGPFKVSFP